MPNFCFMLQWSCPLPAALILVVARLLHPKLRKRGGRLGGKGAPGSARVVVRTAKHPLFYRNELR